MAGSLADITSVAVDGNEVVMKTSAPSVDALYRLTLFRVQSPRFFGKCEHARLAPALSSSPNTCPDDHLTLGAVRRLLEADPVQREDADIPVLHRPGGDAELRPFGRARHPSIRPDQGRRRAEGRGWTAYAAPIADYEMLVLNYTDPKSPRQREYSPGHRPRHRPQGDREERVLRSRPTHHHPDVARQTRLTIRRSPPSGTSTWQRQPSS